MMVDQNRIYDLLSALEYIDDGDADTYCPICYSTIDQLHDPGCELKSIMNELEEECPI